jgi:hypothetical protein
MWVLFHVPCPTPDGRSAKDLYERRIPWITSEMQASAREHGCRFHRAWYARRLGVLCVASWESREGASAFFEQWEIDDEPDEVAIFLEGDVGLVPVP